MLSDMGFCFFFPNKKKKETAFNNSLYILALHFFPINFIKNILRLIHPYIITDHLIHTPHPVCETGIRHA